MTKNYEELITKQLEKQKKAKDKLEVLKKKRDQQSIKSLYKVFGNRYLNEEQIERLDEILKRNNNELLNQILNGKEN